MMRFLALDPAAKFGWALSDERLGTWKLSGDKMMLDLLVKLRRLVDDFDCVICERGGGRQWIATWSQGMKAGIIELLCEQEGKMLVYVSPAEIKKFATGKGNANKAKMKEAFDEKFPHMADRGLDDNAIDSFFILKWAELHVE